MRVRLRKLNFLQLTTYVELAIKHVRNETNDKIYMTLEGLVYIIFFCFRKANTAQEKIADTGNKMIGTNNKLAHFLIMQRQNFNVLLCVFEMSYIFLSLQKCAIGNYSLLHFL